MTITENGNTYVKEKDSVEQYLIRIIQRYFEIEKEYSAASIESIIVESLTRYKRYLKDKGGEYLFSLNGMTGNITVDISSFGGESRFEKKTAFNKNFGEGENDILKGNDSRLSDERIAELHTHEISNIKDLENKLKKFKVPKESNHVHENKNIIDKIRYSGNSLEIDLKIIETIKANIEMYLLRLKSSAPEPEAEQRRIKEKASGILASISSDLNEAKEYIEKLLNFRQAYKEQSDIKIKKAMSEIIFIMDKFIKTEEYEPIKKNLNKIYKLKYEKEIDIYKDCDDTVEIEFIENKNKPDGDHGEEKYGSTMVSTSLTINDASNIKEHDIEEVYVSFEIDDKNIKSKLPMIVKTNRGQSSLQYSINNEGRIKIWFDTTDLMTGYADNNNIYNKDEIIYSYSYGYDTDTTTGVVSEIEDNRKKEFIKQIIKNNTAVHEIQAFYDEEKSKWVYSDENNETKEMECNIQGYAGAKIGIKKDGTYEIIGEEENPAIIKYKIQKLKTFLKNPKITIKVYGVEDE